MQIDICIVHTPVMSTLKSIAVFSGSSAGNDIRFQEAAAKLGCLIGERKIRFIYGGGGLGLMGIAAKHAKERGSYVIGILPELMNTPDVTEGNVESELLVVPDMHERKARMYSLADAFAVLPGGIGTLDEFFEIYTWKQIGYHGKNIALLNTEGYWDPLLEMLDKSVSNGFLSAEVRSSLIICDTPDELIARLEESPA